jgi:hypothetical protein
VILLVRANYGKEIGASYPISRALRPLQYRPFLIRQVIKIQGGSASSVACCSFFFFHPNLPKNVYLRHRVRHRPTKLFEFGPSWLRRHTERVVGRNGVCEFLTVEHTANVRKYTEISAIWHHGGEPRRLDDHSMERYWRYAYCKGSATILRRTLTPERNALGMKVSRGPIRNCIGRAR